MPIMPLLLTLHQSPTHITIQLNLDTTITQSNLPISNTTILILTITKMYLQEANSKDQLSQESAISYKKISEGAASNQLLKEGKLDTNRTVKISVVKGNSSEAEVEVLQDNSHRRPITIEIRQ